ncbi:MAG: Gfo/Idh/MocA family protein [Planctomycetota bacterium]|jgi:predicted dehydrogenase
MVTKPASRKKKQSKKAAKRRARGKRQSKRKLRLGVIGVAGIAGMQLQSLRHRKDVEYVAVCDINEEAMASKKQEYGFQQTYTNWKEMFAKAELDAVSICTPNYLHYEPTIDALEAGCHVMVEKPLAMNVQEGQAMVDTAKKVGRQLVIGFQWRFNPKTQMIKRAVEARSLGRIIYARVWALRRRGIPNWGMFVRKDLQGGGPMIDIGVHAIEMAHYAMGLPKPVAASGAAYTYVGNKPSDAVECVWPGWDHKNYTVEDLATGYVRFQNGATMTIEASFAAHMGQRGLDFTLMGTKGGANWAEPKLFYDRHGYMLDATPAYLPPNEMFKVKMDNFVDCALYGKSNCAPGEHGLMIQKILDAIYKSAETRQEVAIE